MNKHSAYYLKDTHNCTGKGVFTGQAFDKGQVVIEATGLVRDTQTMYTIQVGWDKHLEVDEPARYLNHSCVPNLGVKTMAIDCLQFIALRDIQPGEELTFDYAMTEYMHYTRSNQEDEFDLTCLCGHPSCRGRLGYYSELNYELKEKYGSFFADYLLELQQK